MFRFYLIYIANTYIVISNLDNSIYIIKILNI